MLRQVFDGTMDIYLWDYFTCVSIDHDSLLSEIQDECSLLWEETYLSGATGRHMFNEKGLREIRRLLERLEQAS